MYNLLLHTCIFIIYFHILCAFVGFTIISKCRYVFQNLAQKRVYVLRISFDDTVHFRNQELKKKAIKKELMNERHCIHIPPLPQDSKDSHYKVPSKPLSPEVQHQHFICSNVMATIAPVSPILSTSHHSQWIRDAPTRQLFTDAGPLN